MNQVMPVRLSPGQVMELMGVKAEQAQAQGMSPMAWLLIQHEGQGGTREQFAKGVGVEISEIDSLIFETLGIEGEEAFGTWERGVIALKASGLGGQQRIARGWDDLEAMALEKLGNQLANMQTNGDPKIMLEIAKIANSAIRRSKGEGKGGGTNVSVNAKFGDSGGEVEMASGDIGNITLRFSPKIQEQLGRADRIIDGTAKPAEGGSNQNLQMLRLQETRVLAEKLDAEEAERARLEEQSKVEPKKAPPPKFDMSVFDDDE